MQVIDATINRIFKDFYYSRNAETWKWTERIDSLFFFLIFTAIEILHKEKKKCLNAKSIFEYLKKNETTDISEKQVQECLNQIININLFFNKKTDQGLDSLYKTTEKNNEIPLNLSYIT